MVHTPQAISIAAQKCYLLTPQNNTAIIQCLDKHQKETAESLGIIVLALIIIVVAVGYWIHRD